MKTGRPSLSAEMVEPVRSLRKTGMGVTTISDKLGIGRTSVYRILHERPPQNSSEADGGPRT